MVSFNNAKYEDGFLLIDVLVGLFIASILTTAFIASVVVAVRHAQIQAKAMQAELLAIEMVEVARELEKTPDGWNKLTSGKCDAACHPVPGSVTWEFATSSEPVDAFTRSMAIYEVCRNEKDEIVETCAKTDNHSRKVVASTTWQIYGDSHSILLETYVYNYN